MHKRTRLHAFAVISCLSLGLVAYGQEPAPKADAAAGTIKVAAHQSRWDYPREVTPPAGHSVHIVEKGDTLWDLGTKYLGNPFSWPQIWELNKWVKDPHWIYPGDPLIVDASRTAVPTGREAEAAYEVATLKPDLRRVAKPTQDEYAYSFQDFIQLPFLTSSAAEYYKKSGAFLLHGHQDRTGVRGGGWHRGPRSGKGSSNESIPYDTARAARTRPSLKVRVRSRGRLPRHGGTCPGLPLPLPARPSPR